MSNRSAHSSSRLCSAAFGQYTFLSARIRCPYRLSSCKARLTTQPPSSRCLSSSSFRLNEAVAPQTHYQLFPHTLPNGPPPSGPFGVDLIRLRKEFLQLQSRAHPDLHQGSSKSRAEGRSALINDAYKTLQHPLLRAQYILSLRGIEIAEDEGAQAGDQVDQGLLMEVLEVREAIEEAQTEVEVKALEAENAERIGECLRRLEDFFERDELQGARKEVGTLRYWCAIDEALKGWERGKKVVLEH